MQSRFYQLGTYQVAAGRAPQMAAVGRRRRMAAAAAPLQRATAARAARSSPGVLAGLLLRPGHPAWRPALAAARQSRRTPRALPPLGGRSPAAGRPAAGAGSRLLQPTQAMSALHL